MENIIITSDSTCDLSAEIIKEYGIEICPISILLGDTEYHDTVDIDANGVLKYVKETGVLPKTSATTKNQYKEFFKKYTSKGNTVIHFCISSKSSSCVNNARFASEEVGNVYVIDSYSLSSGQGLQILKACDLKREGKTAKEIVDEINDLRENVQISFVVDTLEFLHKGGRCSSTALVMSKVLKIHPSIHAVDGSLAVKKKYLGSLHRALTQYVQDTAEEYKSYDDTRCIITHSPSDRALCDMVIDGVKQYFDFKEIIETEAGSTVTCHCGYNTIGIIFYKNR